MKKALVGYGGHAREVMAQMGVKLPCFVDEQYVVDGTKPLSEFNPNEYVLMVAVADSKDRHSIVDKLPSNTKYFTWIHPSVLIMDDNVEIGEGTFIGANSIITTNIKIGKHALLNRGNHIGHDCVIGDYFSAMPCSVVGGNVTIGNQVYLGSGSFIREKIKIGNNVLIGMGGVVVKDITSNGTYIGVPVKKMK
jgi:sugar O-acyltransferase (sialic acid O-acetyltransferase NeuD family)